MFRRLGVVAGSASLALIRQLLVEAGLDAWACSMRSTPWSTARWWRGVGRRDEPRYRLLETPRAYALEASTPPASATRCNAATRSPWRRMFDAAYDEYFRGRVGVDDWLRRASRTRQRARRAALGARRRRDRLALRIGATMLRALPPSLHVERMALADACEAAIAPELPEPLQLQAWLELSCVLADTQKARARRVAERALALARSLDASQPDRFALYHASCRAASAAAQTDDLPAARTLLDELQRIEELSWPAQRLLWGCEAAQWFARMNSDAAAALRLGRRLLALDRERGSHASIAAGNLIDAELRPATLLPAARLGATSSNRARHAAPRRPRIRAHQPGRGAARPRRRGAGAARSHATLVQGGAASTCSTPPPPTLRCSVPRWPAPRRGRTRGVLGDDLRRAEGNARTQ